MPLIVHNYAVGRVHKRNPATHQTEPCEPRARFDTVVAVHSSELGQVMNCRDERAIRAHLRRLRDSQLLICPQAGRLTAWCRTPTGKCRMYVFDVRRPGEIPRVPTSRLGRARLIRG